MFCYVLFFHAEVARIIKYWIGLLNSVFGVDNVAIYLKLDIINFVSLVVLKGQLHILCMSGWATPWLVTLFTLMGGWNLLLAIILCSAAVERFSASPSQFWLPMCLGFCSDDIFLFSLPLASLNKQIVEVHCCSIRFITLNRLGRTFPTVFLNAFNGNGSNWNLMRISVVRRWADVYAANNTPTATPHPRIDLPDVCIQNNFQSFLFLLPVNVGGISHWS